MDYTERDYTRRDYTGRDDMIKGLHGERLTLHGEGLRRDGLHEDGLHGEGLNGEGLHRGGTTLHEQGLYREGLHNEEGLYRDCTGRNYGVHEEELYRRTMWELKQLFGDFSPPSFATVIKGADPFTRGKRMHESSIKRHKVCKIDDYYRAPADE